jgi:biotin transport system substrate-specific component
VMRSQTLTLSDALLPGRSLARDLGLVGLFVGITALAAQVRIPLPFTPVPITGQTFAVILCGAAIGARRGACAQLAYLLLGSAGLPVFAGGACGLPFGPSGGYLIGFIPAAYLVGFLVERGWDRRVGTAAVAMLLGNMVVYAFGLPWLAVMVGGPISKVLALGFTPFLPGDLYKLALASALLPTAWAWIGRGKDR